MLTSGGIDRKWSVDFELTIFEAWWGRVACIEECFGTVVHFLV